MIMKNIIISAGIILALLLISCNDEFMEKYPLDQVSDQTFWNSESDLELFCNNFYANFPVDNSWGPEINDLGIPNNLAYRDIITDNCAPWTEYVTTAKGLLIPAGQYITPTASGSG